MPLISAEELEREKERTRQVYGDLIVPDTPSKKDEGSEEPKEPEKSFQKHLGEQIELRARTPTIGSHPRLKYITVRDGYCTTQFEIDDRYVSKVAKPGEDASTSLARAVSQELLKHKLGPYDVQNNTDYNGELPSRLEVGIVAIDPGIDEFELSSLVDKLRHDESLTRKGINVVYLKSYKTEEKADDDLGAELPEIHRPGILESLLNMMFGPPKIREIPLPEEELEQEKQATIYTLAVTKQVPEGTDASRVAKLQRVVPPDEKDYYRVIYGDDERRTLPNPTIHYAPSIRGGVPSICYIERTPNPIARPAENTPENLTVALSKVCSNFLIREKQA